MTTPTAALVEEADLDRLADVIELGAGFADVPHDVARALDESCPHCAYDCMELPTRVEHGNWQCQRRAHVYPVVPQKWLGAIREVREDRQQKRQEEQERADYASALRRAEAEREEARSDVQRAELARWKAEHERDLALTERDEARRDAEAVRAAASYLTEETQQMTHLRASVAGQQKRAEQAEAELDAATTQLAKKFKRLEELERRCTQAESERNELRATVTRLNRRAQTAEAGVRDNVEASKTAGKSMGRTLANAAADMYRRRAEKAEAERHAQHAEVLRLTGELQQVRKESLERARTVLMLDEDLDEARAQVWGLGCKVTNLRNALKRNEQQRRELGWRAASEEATMAEVVRLRFQSLHWFEENERHSKQMRDCLRQKFELTQENARLQARVATLELLRRGGK